MMSGIDHWLAEHPDGQVRFDLLGVEYKCTLAPESQDCYFGRGLTCEAAFDEARRVFERFRLSEN